MNEKARLEGIGSSTVDDDEAKHVPSDARLDRGSMDDTYDSSKESVIDSTAHDDNHRPAPGGHKDEFRTPDFNPASTSPAAETTTAVEPPPNGGYGWVACVCVALVNAHTWGLNSSYAVFLAHYLSSDAFPGASSLDFAFVGSLSIACALLVSPVATTTTRIFSTRVTLFIGIFFETISLIGASFATEIYQLFLSQGICFGFGMGFLFVGSVGIVPQWFTTRRSLANGIATCGSGVGGLVYSLATGAMIRTIGLPWAFRVLGILAFVVNGVCALLLRDRNKIIGASELAFDVKLFKRVEYLLLLAYGFFSMLGYICLLFSIANYAASIGLTSSQGATVSALLNLGQALGRPPIGYFSDSVGRINMAAAMTFLAGFLALVVWIFATSYGVLIFYAIIGGTVAGTFWTTIAPVTAEVVGLKNVPSALSLVWLVLVLPCTFSEPIALEIVAFDGTKYLGAQIFVGFMYIAGSACLLVLRGWKISEVRAAAVEKDDQGRDVIDKANDDKKGPKGMFLANCLRWTKV